MQRLCLVLFALVVSSPLAAQEPQEPDIFDDADLIIPEKDRRRHTAVLIARIAVNENPRILRPLTGNGTAGEPTPDAKALLQEMIMYSKWKDVSLYLAAKHQSPHTTRVKPPIKGKQHMWTSHLPAHGMAMPKHWTKFYKRSTWRRYRKNWVKFREWMIRQVVVVGKAERVCEGKPITWGGQKIDDQQGIDRGFCVIETPTCGSRNSFWTRPGWGCAKSMREIMRENKIPKWRVGRVSVKNMLKRIRKQEAEARLSDSFYSTSLGEVINMTEHDLKELRARCLAAKMDNRKVANAAAHAEMMEAMAGPVPMKGLRKHSPAHLIALADKALRVMSGEEKAEKVEPGPEIMDVAEEEADKVDPKEEADVAAEEDSKSEA